MSKAVFVFSIVAFIAVAATLVFAETRRERSFAFAGIEKVAVAIEPGKEACQTPIDPPVSFSGVTFTVGTYFRSGPPLAVTVRDAKTEETRATARVPRGYGDNQPQTVLLQTIAADRPVSLCVRNNGSARAAIWGAKAKAVPSSRIVLGGKTVPADMALTFFRERPVWSLLADVFRRAALFHPQWVGAWTFWLLAAVVMLVVPLLLAASLATAIRADR